MSPIRVARSILPRVHWSADELAAGGFEVETTPAPPQPATPSSGVARVMEAVTNATSSLLADLGQAALKQPIRITSSLVQPQGNPGREGTADPGSVAISVPDPVADHPATAVLSTVISTVPVSSSPGGGLQPLSPEVRMDTIK